MLGALLLMATLITGSGQPLPKQPSDYTPAFESRVVSWQLKRVLPPSPLYVGVDDNLVVGAATSQTNEVVTVNYRLLRAADGVIVAGQFTVAPASTRAIAVQTQQLAEGFLLSVSVKAAVATTRGMTFVRAFLGAGPFGAGEPSYMLLADYVTTAMAPAHPNGRVLAPSEGPGFVHYIGLAPPVAGNNWVLTCATNQRLRVISTAFLFTTAAGGANRSVFLQLAESLGGRAGWFSLSTPAIPPSTPEAISAATDNASGADTALNLHIPLTRELWLAPGQVFESQCANLAAGDAFTSVSIVVEEWLDNV